MITLKIDNAKADGVEAVVIGKFNDCIDQFVEDMRCNRMTRLNRTVKTHKDTLGCVQKTLFIAVFNGLDGIVDYSGDKDAQQDRIRFLDTHRLEIEGILDCGNSLRFTPTALIRSLYQHYGRIYGERIYGTEAFAKAYLHWEKTRAKKPNWLL